MNDQNANKDNLKSLETEFKQELIKQQSLAEKIAINLKEVRKHQFADQNEIYYADLLKQIFNSMIKIQTNEFFLHMFSNNFVINNINIF